MKTNKPLNYQYCFFDTQINIIVYSKFITNNILQILRELNQFQGLFIFFTVFRHFVTGYSYIV